MDEKNLGATPRRSPEAGSIATESATARHTQGPWAWEWIAEKSNEWAVGQAFREDGTPISGQIQKGEWIEDVVIERRLIGMNESGHANAADAHLIAAAPEMYEALQAMLTLAPDPLGGVTYRAIRERALAALAKAEGQ
jgi:hypothetical protein